MKQENILISHSECESEAQCEQKHAYAHMQKIEPATTSIALQRGNAGHFALETFLKAIKAGETNKKAVNIALNELNDSDDYPINVINEVRPLVTGWMENIFPTLGWKIVEVEREFRMEIEPGLIYPFKVDAIVEIRGELVIIDHKFVADPYSTEVIRLMPQVPRYIGALRQMGIDIRYGKYNFIRTRKLTTMSAYSEEPITPNNDRIYNSFMELVQQMRKIRDLKLLPQERRPIPIRTVNKMNCGHCGFNELCGLELEGRDSTKLREVAFIPNTYGYKDIQGEIK